MTAQPTFDLASADSHRLHLTGMQALTMLPMLQRDIDRRNGLNTAGFVSGYRGSPVGGFDMELMRNAKALAAADVRFQPGLNEDIAATAMIGTQQVPLVGDARVDGVFALWYGKGPGVDRSGDPFKHGVRLGASKHGGVLLAFGDDHAGKSSTVAHASEEMLAANGLAVLYPATIAEYLTFGTFGWAMSRFSGLWVGMKCVNETAEGTASTLLHGPFGQYVLPAVAGAPELNGKLGFDPLGDERRHMDLRLPAAEAFAEANSIDRVVVDSPRRTLGIVTAGKSYLDVMEALRLLGVDEAAAEALGLRVLKLGMIHPLVRSTLSDFAAGHGELLIIEEKSGLIEPQAARLLYNLPADARPALSGKRDPAGNTQFPSYGVLDPLQIAGVIGAALRRLGVVDAALRRLGVVDAALDARIDALAARRSETERTGKGLEARKPWFCSGCPHNSSTRVPDGSIALTGIGCHTMALWMDRDSLPPVQMGGEGGNWIGMAPYVEREHIFQNLGDGTYNHSGLLAIRAAVGAGHAITYKILYNDAVAMTGGQPHDGGLTVPDIVAQVLAERVAKVAVVTDDPDRYRDIRLPAGVGLSHRDALDDVQNDLRSVSGVSVLIYDQTCATELRRRRKRGLIAKPTQRVIINERVCEGCGDCSRASNCVSVEPKPTETGLKRMINQSSCNLDMSCADGFCPSFVLVEGVESAREKISLPVDRLANLPAPPQRDLPMPYSIVVAGIGGTGIVTVNALIGVAAHLEGKSFAAYDMTGLAQKGGAVYSHMRLAEGTADLSPRVGAGEANLLLAADLGAAMTGEAFLSIDKSKTTAVVDARTAPPGQFQLDSAIDLSAALEKRRLAAAVPAERQHSLDAAGSAVALLGDAVYGNVMLLGYIYQLGLLPLTAEALERAIESNGTQVEQNRLAFRLGRFAAQDRPGFDALRPSSGQAVVTPEEEAIDTLIAKRVDWLTTYQDAAYAARYRALVDAVQAREAGLGVRSDALTRAVAISLYRLMAYKDEYEVARLYTDGAFAEQMKAELGTPRKMTILLAPPGLAWRRNSRGEPRKIKVGSWILPILKGLHRMKGLRGTLLDPFRWSHDRRHERALLTQYEALFDRLARETDRGRHGLAVKIAALPQTIRGFGHVKQGNADRADAQLKTLLREWDGGTAQRQAA